MSESQQIKRVRDARAALLLTHPFFGVLSLKLELKETTALPTAGVNDRELVFNPVFVDALTQGELKGLIAHEVLHLALGHHARMGARDKQAWNVACDYALNPVLVDDGFILPSGALINPVFKGMSAEAIYEKLPKQQQQGQGQQQGQQQGQGQGQGQGQQQGQGWGDFESPAPDGSAAANESARQWAEHAAEAARAAKSAGKLPGHLKRELDAALAPRADWKSIFRRFMTDQVRSVQTWQRPNKRFAPALYLPGTRRDGIGEVAVIIDTSGSIGGATLGAFENVLNDILSDVNPRAVHVIYADAAVNHVDSYEESDASQVRLTPHGGGGTDFRPAFARIEREQWPVACAVYLTDLMGQFPPVAPSFPVLWASYGAGDASAPWGETVKIDA